MIVFLEEYKLLLWKNCLIQWRSKASLVVQFVTPILCLLLIPLLRYYVQPIKLPGEIYKPEYLNDPLIFRNLNIKANHTLLYSPKNDLLEKLVKATVKELKLDAYIAYRNSKNMEQELANGTYLCGIEFDDSLMELKDVLPKNFKFSLRFPSELRQHKDIYWDTHTIFPLLISPTSRNMDKSNTGGPPNYFEEGFLSIQHVLSMAYIKEVGGENLPDIHLQRYPFSEQIVDDLTFMSVFFIPLCLIVMYMIPTMFLTKHITREKEHQLKEYMLIIGLSHSIQWLSWLGWGIILFLLPNIALIIMLKIPIGGPPILPETSWSFLCFFILLFNFSCICFAFLCAAIFSRSMPAQLFCILIFYLAGAIFIPYLYSNFINLHYDMKILFSALFINAACLGYIIMVLYELKGEGLQWCNMFQPASTINQMTMGHIILSFIVVGIVTWIFCLYLEKVRPGKYGTAEKWNFLHTKKYWSKQLSPLKNQVNSKSSNSDVFEDVLTNKPILLEINNLKKEFKHIEVVKDVTLKLYKGETTALLGHNGAGKTTTIYMIIGMIKPTVGTAIISGYDITTNKYKARKSLGVCLQENVLFERLTVQNHLEFICTLKGLRGNAKKMEIDKYITLFNLQDYKNTISRNLSGGWKRKLCLCCAFCGGSKILLLDEPTSGLDPTARRHIWKVIQNEKKNRSILLTTHFMDEADVLGDRIAIMASGEVQCYGTSYFLKKKFVSGYTLVCVKLPNCDVNQVTNLLRNYIPDIQPKAIMGAELAYILPENYSAVYAEMLHDLEINLDNLKISDFGMKIASLEDVFLKVGSAYTNKSSIKVNKFINYNKQFTSKARITLLQWSAMALKKTLYAYNNPLLISIQIFLPALFLLIGYFLKNDFNQLDPLTISLKQYNMATIVLEKGADVAKSSLMETISNNYTKFIESHGSKYNVVTLDKNQNFTDYILELDRKNHLTVNVEYIAAATISKKHMIAWLNIYPLHTAPLTINLLHNALLKSVKNNTYDITVINKPLPFRAETLKMNKGIKTFAYGDLVFSINLVCSLFIIFPVKERVSCSKLTQLIAGVSLSAFWLIGFIFDIFIFMLSIFFLIALVTVLCDYTVITGLGYFSLIMSIYGICAILFIYVISFLFKSTMHAYATIFVITYIGIFLGVHQSSLPDIGLNIVTITFFFLPAIHLSTALTQIDNVLKTNRICKNPDLLQLSAENKCRLFPECCASISLFNWERPGILTDVLFLIVLIIFYLLVLVFIEKSKFLWALCSLKNNKKKRNNITDNNDTRDEDVIHEENKIANMSLDELKNQRVVLNRVAKKYGKIMALNRVSFCVEPYECFGLLGVNGAGKSTAFKIMVGDLKMTSGKAYICGFNLSTQMPKIYRKIGYCPQFNGLLEDFTGEQTLLIYGLIHGLQMQQIQYLIYKFGKSLHFTNHMEEYIENYSGGTKRKLCTALAILGLPDVIFLDEPTTGMDPIAKRAAWNLFCLARDNGSSLVLCSHSMHECQALCTRISIMVKGQFVCLGSIQHLKNKFSTGVILKVILKSTNTIPEPSISTEQTNITALRLHQQILNSFPNAQLRESSEGMLSFHIPLNDTKWSKIFGFMEENRQSLKIEDYGIYQESLANIFLQLSSN